MVLALHGQVKGSETKGLSALRPALSQLLVIEIGSGFSLCAAACLPDAALFHPVD